MRITHLTSVHPRNDTRIFYKMCQSLVAHGHQVTLIVADGKGDMVCNGVSIIDVGASKDRFDRIRHAPGRVYAKAVALDSELYHLHDPELMPVGLKLKRQGRRVIFDSHEDVPGQMLGKHYLKKPVAWILSKSIAVYEARACAKFDGVIIPGLFIRDKFLRINPNTIDINNFPVSGELDTRTPWEAKSSEVSYVGGIAGIRGILQMVRAMEKVHSKVRLNLCGQFVAPDVERACKGMPGWTHVNEHGFVDRSRVRDVLARSTAGLVVLHPNPNYINAQPVKMFEYMIAGIPVIASDFPLWREIVVGNRCGLCVDPMDVDAIAGAIDYLIEHPDEARRMGENGRRAVLEKYNWQTEEKKLLEFYQAIIRH